MHITERYWRDLGGGGCICLRQMFPDREGVSPYKFTISMRMSKCLNPWYYLCAWRDSDPRPADLKCEKETFHQLLPDTIK